MPLIRDKVVGHDEGRMTFKFTMLNNTKVVSCQISDAAMDQLAGNQGTESRARQAQFLSLRDAIEQIASELFDKAPPIDGYVVRIFAKHTRREPMPPSPQSVEPVVSSTPTIAPNVTAIQDSLKLPPESGDGESRSAAGSHENTELDCGDRAD
jgi:hypothetical protein